MNVVGRDEKVSLSQVSGVSGVFVSIILLSGLNGTGWNCRAIMQCLVVSRVSKQSKQRPRVSRPACV